MSAAMNTQFISVKIVSPVTKGKATITLPDNATRLV
jgi:hypothetical protein